PLFDALDHDSVGGLRMNKPATLGSRLDGRPVDDRQGSLDEGAPAGGDVIAHHRKVVEAFALGRQTARHRIVHVRLVDRLHQLDAHLAVVAREGEEDAADTLDCEVGLRELLEAELVAPDSERRLDVVHDDADVTNAVEHGLSSCAERWSSTMTRCAHCGNSCY